jgi:ATP phosphoribosyltransferase regulatory subunit
MQDLTRSPVRLPHGVRDYLPEATERRRAITDALRGEFARWGYRGIVTPAFEYEAVLRRGLGPGVEAVRFVEPATGEVVALRPDITPQVARLAATRLLAEPGPTRLSYEGAVVRLSSSAGGARELYQAGVELLDAPSPAGDAEVIALAAAALSAAGLERFTLDLGEAQVARAALAGLDGAAHEELRLAIGRKDVEEVARLGRAANLPAARRRLLEALPSLYGGAEAIDRARTFWSRDTPGGTHALAALTSLATVVQRLGALGLDERVSVDLGEVRGFDYYTGVRFQGFAPGVGEALLSGGRYDGLVARYGRPARAAGFAVDVERVADALRESGAARSPSADGVYLAGAPSRRSALAAALRASGVRVIEELDEPPPDEPALLRRAIAAGAERLLILGDARRPARASWIDVDGPPARVEVAALDAFVAGAAPLDAVLPPRYLTPPGAVSAAGGTRSRRARKR